MCLTTIKKVYPEPKVMRFYKVMYRVRRVGQPNIYYFPWWHGCGGITKGEVKQSSNGKIESNDSRLGYYGRINTYRAGFHGFTSLRTAARRVSTNPLYRRYNGRYRNGIVMLKVVVLCEGPVRTVGSQMGGRVVVADTMKILREIPLAELRRVQGLKPIKKK